MYIYIYIYIYDLIHTLFKIPTKGIDAWEVTLFEKCGIVYFQKEKHFSKTNRKHYTNLILMKRRIFILITNT